MREMATPTMSVSDLTTVFLQSDLVAAAVTVMFCRCDVISGLGDDGRCKSCFIDPSALHHSGADRRCGNQRG